ncbi:MAG: hypothetical protein A2408_00925 [Candidatus Yonathbacteria bacterium RIFOXYC1_FULL_52_10]|uniref:Transglutaminase-like domain-containing protein n=1 Tax=Candidatus Yonathbacteria bacterium RIFOXYD1_FULL_52_36 TaxID=1802730 RepID=A0A1G2SMZ6_9BACT|nr:MAG: hypothetical protein A2408_00925 [Candidatus Yonathbacteria bacterium RIFOXYC1_FULL_52_10]OHA86356.1 MAG: hypothetical protein A2591_02555 [Candidatus Yonathbacteria bacterium RIFOXYD1_FULL_52_36]
MTHPFGLSPEEYATLKRLSTPEAIQDFLDELPINHEKRGETCFSPRMVLREQRAHCLEGALLAAAALWLAGERPLLLNFKTLPVDQDHAVTLYKRNGYWGALSKTNHAVLRCRDPIYRTIRELALSYFHEYFMTETGKKTLRWYSRPFSLKQFGSEWITAEEDLWDIAYALVDAPHLSIVPEGHEKHIRPASSLERKMCYLAEWKESNPRT